MSGNKEPPKKKIKVDDSSVSAQSNLKQRLDLDRKETADSILNFKFNKKRVRILSKATEVPEDCKGIAYWMFRDERVQDNWAFLFAQKLALKNKVPLHVCFCLLTKFLDGTIRQFKFLLKGLKEVQNECKELNIEFHMLYGSGADVMPGFVEKNKIGALVIDFMPLRNVMAYADQLKKTLPKNVPLCQVDAHNIVPCWEASNKLEYGARTIRPKIHKQLPEFLTQFPPVIKHPYSGSLKADEIDWERCEAHLECDKTVEEVSWAVPGYSGGIATLESFINKRLKIFGAKRNDPTQNALSNISPWLHFGQVSAQRCILVVKALRSKYPESVDGYIEEAIVRRELSDNFCFYNPKYDSIEGTNDWAKKTLEDHRKDKRPYLYTREELRDAKTHDDLWNSAQIQLVKEGKMHGFLRMYWAKKILEWTASPEQALADAIYLNDRYSLDGRDPSGYVGCMWSVCGIHDQGWGEREVFGKIRYMNYQGCKRKFDIAAFIARYGGKVHTKSAAMDKFLAKGKKK
ncbi:Deoxyribodipyrimidine photo-lyase [Frankliniella fusca]|uniref:Deoxyribodipyrimidine photo-lyase n=1 Tax=Frankliniella fusca TaxID=407009 RepID=A0AAE1H4R7_9NEOP|nr:Deoxyribodipyrimidine photo-lyase [Frankliniella fusca]